MYDAVADDCCYPGTTVLKNKLDLRDGGELTDFEAEVSDTRSDEEAPGGDLEFTHLARHSVDLERFDPDAFLAAMITSFKGDEAPLTAIIVDLVGE